MIEPRGARRVGVVAKAGSVEAAGVARELIEWLARRGLEVFVEEGTAREAGAGGNGPLTEAARCDLVVVLGGDGTLLSVARKAAGGPPILGVNLGHLGFLTEVPRADFYPELVEVLAGRYAVEPRSLLEVEQTKPSGERFGFRALNDVVLAKSALSRMIELLLTVDGKLVARYRADGLVVSTPTGSTAYNLSAGGPILHPLLPVSVLTPICPHTLTLRPLVVPDSSVIEVTIETRADANRSRADRVYLTVDGQEGGELAFGDRVRITRASQPAYLVRTGERGSIFEGLRNKLHWGE
ncbi:MAG: NAD(+)/NADH kinase [Thermoanaerobaculia bacterium]